MLIGRYLTYCMAFLVKAHLAASIAMAVEPEPLQIVTEQLPPFNFLEDGIPRGLSTEVVQAVLEETGREAEISFFPWARSYRMALSTPNTLIYSIMRTQDREDLFNWVGGIAPYGVSFYSLADNTDIRLTTLEDAMPLTVGVYLGDAKAEYLTQKGFENLSTVETDRLNLRQLLLGRIDLMVIDDTVIVDLMRSEGVSPDRVHRALPITDLSGHAYMAFNKDTDPALVEEFRKALGTIKANGVYDEILSKYLLLN